ncbi:hypothetical protein [Bradyrhizobium sp. 142]|uniref:alpha/beta hydrolase family protein n=1 Tax=Bradyrhizobium sp. 142 TaxID=2782618 RepID=UPI001FF8F0CB|nr:hypothetical protein [Bradyrhizobium sp. 142]MCK1727130.1 hypothetical protein [Bradyrhizobium sp. 142]
MTFRLAGIDNQKLSSCLDYLCAQQEVDASRIGIYGEGLSAALATDSALADRRIAAAVCDGGLWTWARTQASISWMTETSHLPDGHLASAHRSRLARRLKCPILVVAGGRSIVSIPEAIKLESDCRAARIDLKLLMPRLASISDGEFENFAACDEVIFAWLGACPSSRWSSWGESDSLRGYEQGFSTLED